MTATREGSGPTRKLTRREREVLTALCAPLAEGGAFVEPASSSAIADALGVSEAAVKQHLLKLYDKFQIHEGEERRRTRLANQAVEANFASVAPPERASQKPEPDALDLARRAAALRNFSRAFEELSRLPVGSLEGSAEAQELLAKRRSGRGNRRWRSRRGSARIPCTHKPATTSARHSSRSGSSSTPRCRTSSLKPRAGWRRLGAISSRTHKGCRSATWCSSSRSSPCSVARSKRPSPVPRERS